MQVIHCFVETVLIGTLTQFSHGRRTKVKINYNPSHVQSSFKNKVGFKHDDDDENKMTVKTTTLALHINGHLLLLPASSSTLSHYENCRHHHDCFGHSFTHHMSFERNRIVVPSRTLPETKTLLKLNGWKVDFLLELHMFRCYVGFGECIVYNYI